MNIQYLTALRVLFLQHKGGPSRPFCVKDSTPSRSAQPSATKVLGLCLKDFPHKSPPGSFRSTKECRRARFVSMPLSPKERKCLANNQSALLQFTRKQEAQALLLRTKQRIEALHEQDREKRQRALLEEQPVVQRALLKEQRDYFLNVICIIILAFCAAILFFQHFHLSYLKDNNLF